MRFSTRQSGISLIEQTVVIAVIAILAVIAMPSAKKLFDNLHTPSGTKATISSALASARAIAIREHQYAGIRFQHACYRNQQGDIEPLKSPLKMPQYMIFIIYDNEKTGLVNGFRAVEGIEPIKLPDNIGVMDLVINKTEIVNTDSEITQEDDFLDTTTFSIIFSPSGKLIVRDVQVRNRDGADYNDSYSEDDIFNTLQQVEEGIALFIQDEDTYESQYGLAKEPSRRSFVIYERAKLREVPANERWDRYLEDLQEQRRVYINPYTGTFIKR